MNIAFSILLNFALIFHPSSVAGKIMPHHNYVVGYDTTSRKIKTRAVNFPVPAVPSKLFYVQRDPNTNTIVYDLNVNTNGEPDKENPVHVYWIKYNERGQKEELNFIQRKFAYGLVTKPLDNGKFDVRFVSYKKYPLSLMKSATDNKYHIYATIDKKQAILNKIFIRIEGGTFWVPNVVYVEVKGTDPATGKEIMERFKP
ncbi:DUF4833 domain-containing protein [Mucilaginibacter paludis]|uniref:DUF4833 domain-containing protein n=1 Tax=Mucilaginibacter paludis DSM 18603 TaxID=714943 RepID=H1Y1B3_9SPHI|nr:DUF4833 domain-containing protein [Mucilaginibacter paludis]EHQ30247.1 hypothetical protein Mucpa_6190 [Mucilaginibacter paludis DSM 18603]